MKMKGLTVVLSLLMVIGMLAGCAKSNEQNESDNKQAANSTDMQKAQPVTIKFMHFSDTASEAMYAELTEAFSKKHPNIKVELLKSDINTYDEKLTVTLTGAGAVDAFAFKNPIIYYQFASTNRVPALDDRVAKDKENLKGVENLYDTLKIDGKLYGLPFRKDIWALFYNKKIFDDAKLPYPKADMTWQEYSELAKKLTTGEGQNKIWGSFSPDWPQVWYGYAHQTGVTYFDENMDPFLEALKWRLDLVNSKANPTIAENKATNAHYRPAFLSGKYAMVYVGTWFAGMLNQDLKDGKLNFAWDMTYIPHPPGVEPGTAMTSTAVHAISPNTKYADEAFQFIAYISGEEGQKIVAKHLTPASSLDSVKEVYVKSFTNPVNLDPLFKIKAVAEKPMGQGMPQLEKIFTEEGDLALLGQQTPEQAIAKIKERRKVELK